MPEGTSLFALGGAWIDVATFASGAAFAAISAALALRRRDYAAITPTALTNDMLRGITALPLALFALGPLFPALADAARGGNGLLLAVGAANALFTVVADWLRHQLRP